ncbi:MAG: hypothetical protein FWF03_02760 [Defluviitaleaceae bacterium]|nr:hypothetical protein [Defluviitaleaceae bacterium]
MDSLNIIREKIIKGTTERDRRVEGVWGVDCLYSPEGNGRTFKFKFLLAQTAGLGCAYSARADYPPEELDKYIGTDFLAAKIDDTALEVAFMDSAYPAVEGAKPAYFETRDDVSVKKMRWRSELIYREAEHLLGKVEGADVVNVGVVGDILTLFSERGANIVGTDYDAAITGRKLFGKVDIIDGSRTLEQIARSNLCIVTGMTITNRTIDGIIDCCAKNSVKIIVFAETGANLGAYYAANGVDSYLGETFPFYIFNGPSRIDVYRRKG